MTGRLEALKILVAESRELDLFAAMLEAESAIVVRCPLVRILDLDDKTEIANWASGAVANPFDDLILLTGEGLRRIVAVGGEDFVSALKKMRTITRGPKPARALRELGLNPNLTAPEPTSQGVLDALEAEDIRGRRIGVQLYPGEGTKFLMDALRARGALVFPILPYRYASQTESARVADIIRDMASGKIDVITVTSTPQIERLAAVAREFGLEAELKQAYAKTHVASMGPVVEQALKAHGITPAIQPEASFHLKPLVRALITWREQCR